MKMLFITFIIGVCLVYPCMGVNWDSSKVPNMNVDNYDSLLPSPNHTFVEFFSKGCPHCQRFFPILEEVYNITKGLSPFRNKQYVREDVFIYKIEGPQNRNLLNKHRQIRGYPSFTYFAPNSTNITQLYSGERSKEKILEWIESIAVPVVTQKKQQEQIIPHQTTQQEQSVEESKQEDLQENIVPIVRIKDTSENNSEEKIQEQNHEQDVQTQNQTQKVQNQTEPINMNANLENLKSLNESQQIPQLIEKECVCHCDINETAKEFIINQCAVFQDFAEKKILAGFEENMEKIESSQSGFSRSIFIFLSGLIIGAFLMNCWKRKQEENKRSDYESPDEAFSN